MVRVLHIMHTLSKGCGLMNFVMNYYRLINRTHIQFDFLYFKEAEDDFKEEITALGGKYYKLTEPLKNIRYIKERNEFFAEHAGEYTAIHCHALFAAAIYGKAANKHGIKNIISHSHNVGYGVGFFRKLRNYYMVKQAKKMTTCKMACSEDAAEFMFGNKALANGEITIISNAIDFDKFTFNETVRNEARRELGLGQKYVVGHVGVFAPQKNHDFVVDVFYEIYKANPDSVLVLIGGDGKASYTTKQSTIEKVNKLGLADNVKFLGIRRDVNRLMCAMDAFVFPSIFEGFGIVLLEAQAVGLPSFASEEVPRTAKCTDLLCYLPLSDGAEKWAEIILSTDYSQDRHVNRELFREFDIKKKAEIMENIYLSMGEQK